MNKSSFEQNGGTYRTVRDYKIPNLALPAEANKPLGVWGLKRKDYLVQHKRAQFNIMLMNGTCGLALQRLMNKHQICFIGW